MNKGYEIDKKSFYIITPYRIYALKSLYSRLNYHKGQLKNW